MPKDAQNSNTMQVYITMLQLVRDQKWEDLDILLETHPINLPSPLGTPIIYQLALEAETELVNKLLAKGASIDSAVTGYAIGGRVNEVKELLQQGASIDWAVIGYAIGGHVNEVKELLQQGASIHWAVTGYARGGHVNEVKELLKQGASIDSAVTGYAIGGRVNEVKELLQQGASIDWAVIGYASGGYIQNIAPLTQTMPIGQVAYLRGFLTLSYAEELYLFLSYPNPNALCDAIYPRGLFFKNEDSKKRLGDIEALKQCSNITLQTVQEYCRQKYIKPGKDGPENDFSINS